MLLGLSLCVCVCVSVSVQRFTILCIEFKCLGAVIQTLCFVVCSMGDDGCKVHVSL